MKIHGTKVGSDGTGYYRGSDGKYYYGNPQNGYLTETIQSQKQVAQMASVPELGYGDMNGAYSSPISCEGGFLESVMVAVAGIAAAALMAAILIAVIISSIIYCCISVWPFYFRILMESYRGGAIDLATILVTIMFVSLLVYFISNAYIIISKRQMRSKHFLFVCTIVMTILLSIVSLMAGGLTLGVFINNVLNGVAMASLPVFMLCFFEHLITKELRGDKRWFITRISMLISIIFIGHETGMIIFGILALIGGWFFNLIYKSVGIELGGVWDMSPQIIMVVGIISVVMGILAKKNKGA